jgi:hypothetical protein
MRTRTAGTHSSVICATLTAHTRLAHADQFFVGLISVAVALPVDYVLAQLFELANESDAPQNWVDAPGKWKLLLGKDAHNGWHLADPAKPVSALMLALIGEQARDFASSLLMLPLWLLGRLRGRCAARAKPHGRDDAPADDDADQKAGAAGKDQEDDAQSSRGGGSSHARAHALHRRLYASAGLLGVYVCWTIFAWCVHAAGVVLVRSLLHVCRRRAGAHSPHLRLIRRFIFTCALRRLACCDALNGRRCV